MLLLSFLLFGATAAVKFELEGQFSPILHNDVLLSRDDHKHFLKLENDIKQKINSSLSGKLESFHVQKFDIHAEDIHPTAIFTVFFKTILNREEILNFFAKDQYFTIFRLKEIETLPDPPLHSLLTSIVTNCQNGGFLLPNHTCVCPSFFTGDNCEITNCLHGGIADRGRCACPPGVYALNCEQRGCLPQVKDNLDISQESFVIVLNQKSSMAYIINSIANNLGHILTSRGGSNPFANYILVNYVQTDRGLLMSKNAFGTVEDLMEYLNSLVYTSTGTDRQPTNRAILAAQSFYPFMKAFSTVFVFADSLDSEAGPENYTLSANSMENAVIFQTLAWRNSIVFMLSQKTGDDLVTSDDGYQTFVRISKATLGDVISYDNAEIKTLLNIIPNYAASGTISIAYDMTTTKKTDILVENDDYDDILMLVLVTVPPGGTLPSVTNKNGEHFEQVLKGARFALYEATTFDGVFVVEKSVKWSLRGWESGYSNFITGYSSTPQVDVGTVYTPADYLEWYMSGEALGAEFLNLSTWTIGMDGKVLSKSNSTGLRRNECSTNYQFGPFSDNCKPGPFAQVFSMVLEKRSSIYRIVPGYCVSMDPKKKIYITCANGGTPTSTYECICPQNFTGQHCETPKCVNGALPNPFPGNGNPLCSCLPGYSGDFCEIMSCTKPTNFAPPPYSPSISVIIQSTLSQAEIAPNIQNGLKNLVSTMTGEDAYQNMILTTFGYITNNGKSANEINTTVYTDRAKFQAAVDTIQYRPSPSDPQRPYEALMNTLSALNITRSPVFLFVDSQPLDSSLEGAVVSAAVATGIRLTIVVTPAYGMECISSNYWKLYQTLTYKTGGTFLNLCQKYDQNSYQKNPIEQLFAGFGVAHHRTESINEIITDGFYEKPDLYFYVSEPLNPTFVVVNCPSTEFFSATLFNNDFGTYTQLNSFVSMPFFAVYQITPTAINWRGYQVALDREGTSSDGPCLVQAMVKSNQSAYILFSPDPSFDGAYDHAEYVVTVNPVLHLSSNQINTTHTVQLSIMSDLQGHEDYLDRSENRENTCTFEYFYNTRFTCNKPDDSFIIRIAAVTLSGTQFQRSLRAYCYLAQGKCANGGYKLQGTNVCKCPPDYAGSLCQEPKCRNDGFIDQNFQCNCGRHYTGAFCQYPTCSWNFMESVDPRISDFKQVTFVLNRNLDNLLVNVQLAGLIQKIVDATESNSVPVMYTLITFDQLGVQRVSSTSHADQFVASFQNAVNDVQKIAENGGTRSLDALNEAYKLNIQLPGVIYLFTAQPALAASASTIDNYLQQKINTQVNVFYTPQKTDYPTLPIDANSKVLMQAVKQSGGKILPITQNSVSQIDQLLISSSTARSLIYDASLPDCTRGGLFEFNVESEFKRIEITVTGVDVALSGQVSFTDGTLFPFLPDSNSTIFKDNGVFVTSFNFPNVMGGLWTVYITTTSGGCSVQARVDSKYRIFPGFTIDSHDDFVHQVPFSGLGTNRSTYMTFRFINDGEKGAESPFLTSMEIYQTNLTSLQSQLKPMKVLSLYPRDINTCAYQYVSAEWIVANTPEQKFVVMGLDSEGNSFQRVFFYTFPLLTERTETCLHGSHDTYGQCVCTDKTQWSGDYCQNIVCQNGGTSSYGICVCPNGYYGEYCEKLVYFNFKP